MKSTPDASERGGAVKFTREQKAHAAQVVKLLAPVIPALAEALQPRTEVVLHDMTKFPNTIAAIGGTITGRDIGGPLTDQGVQAVRSGRKDHIIRYRSDMPDGTVMRSSTIMFEGPGGRAVASLCINTDVQDLERAQRILTALIGSDNEPLAADAPTETFPVSVESLTEGILRDAIAAVGVPIDLMKKTHKVAVVRELDKRGFFTIREAVEIAAARLDVSRYTIYNYLNELDTEQ